LTNSLDVATVRHLMKILVIGSGGREHALTWKLRESPQMDEIYCAPGNAGITQEAECVPVDVNNPAEVLALASDLKAGLTVVGPEAPLVAGVADAFEEAGMAIVGPTSTAARLEGSKIFAKEFMRRNYIPTARFVVPKDFEDAVKSIRSFDLPLVVKADGLAAGKGVVVARSYEEAAQALDGFMRKKTLGQAGEKVVIEEGLSGEEVSFIVLTDGKAILPLPLTQDHKTFYDGDVGPNTGGMGAYSDDHILDDLVKDDIIRRIIFPTLAGMSGEGSPYRGFLYCGLMLTAQGPQVLEYNVRLGDPEAQPIMMRLRTDLVEAFRSMLNGELGALDVHWTPNPSVCVVMASEGYPGAPITGREITGYDLAEGKGGVKVFHAGTKMRDRQLITTGGRVLGVTASDVDLSSAIERVYSAVSKIRFEGMHYRTDIGARGLRRQRSKREIKLPSDSPGKDPARVIPN
jgi:phosphoribosylamine---glycine ligase